MKKIRLSTGKKSTQLFVVILLVLGYAAFSMVDDVRFYFHSAPPINLGEAMTPDKQALAKLHDGDYVKVHGIRAVQGGTVTKGFWGDKYTIFYFSGSDLFIGIQKTPKDKKVGPEYMTLRGRAYSFKTDADARKYRDFFKKQLLLEMSPNGWLIRGEEPKDERATAVIFAVVVFLLLLNIVLMVRQIMEKPEEEEFEADE